MSLSTSATEPYSGSDSDESPQATPIPLSATSKPPNTDNPSIQPQADKPTKNKSSPYIIHGSLNQTLIIFDWDDTLHPTSQLRRQSGSALDIDSVRSFCLSVYETLLRMIRLYGANNIYIVSNADKLWIQRCLQKLSSGYFVNIYHLIQLYNIQIISAKNQFSKQYPNNQRIWKQLTFEYLVKKHYAIYNILYRQQSNKHFSVVSIGDSENEYVASKVVINRLNASNNSANNKILLHRVKLLENPSMAQLVEQYTLIKKIASFFLTERQEINIDYKREMINYRRK